MVISPLLLDNEAVRYKCSDPHLSRLVFLLQHILSICIISSSSQKSFPMRGIKYGETSWMQDYEGASRRTASISSSVIRIWYLISETSHVLVEAFCSNDDNLVIFKMLTFGSRQ